MANKKSKSKQKKGSFLPVIAGVVLVIALALVRYPGDSGRSPAQQAADGALIIPTAEVTTTASFYPVTIEGTEMEVLAVRTATGEIRTAFNTCQSCYRSGHGYYETDGEVLVCQNCGFRFTADEVGVEVNGGCNPWPIPAAQRADTDNEIRIPYEALQSGKAAFAH